MLWSRIQPAAGYAVCPPYIVTCGSLAAVTTRNYAVETKPIQHWSDDHVQDRVYCSACLVHHVIKEQHICYPQWKWITVLPYQLFLRIIDQVVSLLRTRSALFLPQPDKTVFIFLNLSSLPSQADSCGGSGVLSTTHVLHTSLMCTH